MRALCQGSGTRPPIDIRTFHAQAREQFRPDTWWYSGWGGGCWRCNGGRCVCRCRDGGRRDSRGCCCLLAFPTSLFAELCGIHVVALFYNVWNITFFFVLECCTGISAVVNRRIISVIIIAIRCRDGGRRDSRGCCCPIARVASVCQVIV